MNKVSVITTVYNDSSLMQKCLESIRDQDVEDIEVEHVIWDDGSDSTAHLEEVTKDFDVKLYTGNQNVGLGAARNLAVRTTDSDALLFLDADDYFSQNAVRALVQACEGVLSPVYPAVHMFGEINQFLPKQQWTKQAAMRDLFIPSSSLVTRSAFEKVDGFTEGMPLFEDFDMWYRMAKEGIRGCACNSAVLYYNVRADTMSDHFNQSGGNKVKRETYKRIVSQ